MMFRLCKNLTRFFTNVALYLGDDKHGDLKTNLGSIYAGLNAGFAMADAGTKDEKGQKGVHVHVARDADRGCGGRRRFNL